MTTTSKRYAVFVWNTYYPRGGLHDFDSTFDSVEEAEARGYASSHECFQVVDMTTFKILREESSDFEGGKTQVKK